MNRGLLGVVLIVILGGAALASTTLAGTAYPGTVDDNAGGPAPAASLSSLDVGEASADSAEMKNFGQLSPDNQNIAWALFNSQGADSQKADFQEVGDTRGKTGEEKSENGAGAVEQASAMKSAMKSVMKRAWGLEDIVAAKESGMDWEQIFKQMKSEGLIAGETLEQVRQNYLAGAAGKPDEKFLAAQRRNPQVAGAQRTRAQAAPRQTGLYKTRLHDAGLQSQIVITNAAGGRIVVGLAERTPLMSRVASRAANSKFRNTANRQQASQRMEARSGRNSKPNPDLNVDLIY